MIASAEDSLILRLPRPAYEWLVKEALAEKNAILAKQEREGVLVHDDYFQALQSVISALNEAAVPPKPETLAQEIVHGVSLLGKLVDTGALTALPSSIQNGFKDLLFRMMAWAIWARLGDGCRMNHKAINVIPFSKGAPE